jgi:hypothetical protein
MFVFYVYTIRKTILFSVFQKQYSDDDLIIFVQYIYVQQI